MTGWSGRSSKPAETGEVPATDTQALVLFATRFPTVPLVRLPATPGVTTSLGEVTEEGFFLTVAREDDIEPAAIEWIATTAELQED